MSIDTKKIAEWKAAREACDTDDGLGSDVLMTDSDLSFFHVAKEAVPALLADREEMLALLRKVEWSRYDGSCSLDCGGYEEPEDLSPQDRNLVGHRPGCRLASAIREEP